MKECPFCKKPAELVNQEIGDCNPRKYWGVACTDPKCWASADGDCCWHDSPNEACDLWDRRLDEFGSLKG